MRTLMASSIYGGRIDNDTDQRLLVSFISSVFKPERCVSFRVTLLALCVTLLCFVYWVTCSVKLQAWQH